MTNNAWAELQHGSGLMETVRSVPKPLKRFQLAVIMLLQRLEELLTMCAQQANATFQSWTKQGVCCVGQAH